MKCLRVLALGLGLAAPCLLQAALPPTLQEAFTNLYSARTYQLGFPPQAGPGGGVVGKTQRQVREDYLGDPSPKNKTPFDILSAAVDLAVQYRVNNYFGNTFQRDAQEIAWESLESMLQGQLIAGNGNLLRGFRVPFPNDGPERPSGETLLPFGCPGAKTVLGLPTGQPYVGAYVTDLCYARLHFFRGISRAMEFMSQDSSGALRVTDLTQLNDHFPQYTVFDDTNAFPNLNDPNHDTPEDIQTTGYLLGNLIDRYGKAYVGIADRLWRAAYADKERAPGKPGQDPPPSRPWERAFMLQDAVRELQKGAHAQFLASLPLAATFDEGETGYTLCRVDQVRTTSKEAGDFVARIQRGDVPKLELGSVAVSTNMIRLQRLRVEDAKLRAASTYALAEQAIWKVKTSEQQTATDAQQLRSQFKTRLFLLVNRDPDGTALDGVTQYGGLTTAEGRAAYRKDIATLVQGLSASGASSSAFTNSGQLGIAVLAINRAFSQIASARKKIDSIPQLILIDEQRVGAINQVMLGTEERIEAYQLAKSLADSVSVGVGHDLEGPFAWISWNPMVNISALYQNEITRAQTLQSVSINNIDAAATIRKLLLDQDQFITDLDTSFIDAQVAIAGLNGMLAEADRLIEDHTYYEESNGKLWYHDPALVFEREKAEVDYENALNDYKRELYVLAEQLASRWAEQLANPVQTDDTRYVTLGGGSYDDFTQPESVFNIYSPTDGDRFYSMLGAWDTVLTQNRTGAERQIISPTFFLRRDLLGYSEIRYNSELGIFETDPDPAKRELQLRRFRAYLLDRVLTDSTHYWLRLEFSLPYGAPSLSALLSAPVPFPVIRAGAFDYNTRIVGATCRIVGDSRRVAPGSTVVPIYLYQYGKVEVPEYYPRRGEKLRPEFLTYTIPTYYDDPQEQRASPFKIFFNASFDAGGAPGQFEDSVELSPFCDRYVLLIPKGGELPLLNVENLEDIEFNFLVKSGKPSAVF